MDQAVSFARQQWTGLSSSVGDAALRGRVDQAITSMDRAATDKNKAEAAAAGKAELDLVDALETWFKAH